MKTITRVSALQHTAAYMAFLSALIVVPFLFYGTASAETSAGLSVSTNGMTATVSFTRPTPCSAYELDWGDSEEDVVEAIDEMCIQVIEEKTLRHTYDEEGAYTITLTQSGETWSDSITVPGEEVSFGLDDVVSMTAKWIDPYELMADEEYYIYTITLENGDEVVVEAGGFTTVEYRNEQFTNAGYTGDVDALLALVAYEDAEEEEPTPATEGDKVALYQELVTALKTLIERMEALLQLRG